MALKRRNRVNSETGVIVDYAFVLTSNNLEFDQENGDLMNTMYQ